MSRSFGRTNATTFCKMSAYVLYDPVHVLTSPVRSALGDWARIAMWTRNLSERLCTIILYIVAV